MSLFVPARTVRELLAQHYAYLMRAAVARQQGTERYTRDQHRLARAFYRDLLAGRRSISGFMNEERERLTRVAACVYCGDSARLSIDHLVPRLKGGPDDSNNLMPACRRCNSSKGSRDVVAWCAAKGRSPSRAVLRRYVKLAWRWCERTGSLDREIEDVGDSPFDFVSLATFEGWPDRGGFPLRWE